MQALELDLLDRPESTTESNLALPFQPFILRRRLPWSSVVVSGCLHCIAVLFLLSLPVLSPDREIEHRKPFNRAAVQLLQFPDRLYVVRPITAAAKVRAVAGSPQKSLAVRAAQGGRQKSAIKVRVNASARAANEAKLQQTLIRPELPKIEQYDVKLPSFLLWNAPKPVPPPRRLTLRMDPAPKVETDNLQPPKVAAIVEPHLALQPPPMIKSSSAAPAKPKPHLAEEPSELLQAESAQILSLSSVFIPVPRSLEIPALNQVGGTAGADVGQGSGSKGTSASAANGRDGSGHASDGGGTEGELAGRTGVLPIENVNTGNEAGGLGGANGAAAGSGSASATAHPETGTFDIVIEQSSGEAGIPGAANLLHGAPIYTVYLQVGDWKEWVLEYCAADAAPSRAAETGVVQLGSPVRIESPYPLVTVRPQVRQAPGKRYFLLHGMINADGKPVDFRPVHSVDPVFSEAALSAVRQWKFRPAKRDGAALEVEAVIAIPAPPS